jgi:hypothetical protein
VPLRVRGTPSDFQHKETIVATTTLGKNKIHYAVEAFERLVENLIRPSIDRVAVLSAGNTCRVECDFTSDIARVRSAIRSLTYTNRDEKTRLWDTLADGALAFWRAGRRNVPWVKVDLTDGGDNASTVFKKDPVGAGQFMRNNFTFEPSNYLALVGVGEDKNINRPALEKFALAARCPAIAIKDFTLLEDMLLRIALQITTGLTGVRYSLGSLSWTELQRVRNLVHVPLDLMVTIDRSGSMYVA